MNYIDPYSEKFKRIFEFIKKELQVPEGVSELHIHMHREKLIEIECTYFPKGADKE